MAYSKEKESKGKDYCINEVDGLPYSNEMKRGFKHYCMKTGTGIINSNKMKRGSKLSATQKNILYMSFFCYNQLWVFALITRLDIL